MSDTAALERWYRRLLASYPAEHRRTYGEEMIGVLLASAPEGRRRPGVADVLDLIKGGLRARLRPAGGGDVDAGWRDTFAVFSIAAPIGALAYYVIAFAAMVARVGLPVLAAPVIVPLALHGLIVVLAIGAPPLMALLRLRRTAIAVALIAALFVALVTIGSYVILLVSPYAYAGLIWYSLYFAVEVLALAVSPGPARGATFMTRPAWAATVAISALAGLGIGFSGIALGFHTAMLLPVIGTVGVAGVIAILATMPRPIGWRLLLLLAIPAYPAAIALSGLGGAAPFGTASPSGWALFYLPVVALICLVAVLAWRSRRRGSAAS